MTQVSQSGCDAQHTPECISAAWLRRVIDMDGCLSTSSRRDATRRASCRPLSDATEHDGLRGFVAARSLGPSELGVISPRLAGANKRTPSKGVRCSSTGQRPPMEGQLSMEMGGDGAICVHGGGGQAPSMEVE